MSMTRKDFVAIAGLLADAIDRDYTPRQWAESMADYLATQNPRFDRTRFLEACEPRTARATRPDPRSNAS